MSLDATENGANLMLGQNSRGQWVVRDASCRRGGVFVSLAEAKRYLRLQSMGRQETSIMVPGVLELDLPIAA